MCSPRIAVLADCASSFVPDKERQRRGERNKERQERNRKEKPTARKETHKAVIRNRDIYRSSERGLEKREGEKRQKSPAAVYQESYQRLKGAVFTQVLHWARVGCVLEKLSDKR